MDNERSWGSSEVNPSYQEWVSAMQGERGENDVAEMTSEAESEEVEAPMEIDIEQCKKIGERFLKNRGRLWESFAGDRLKYDVNAEAVTFAYYHREKKVEAPAKWFNGEYTDGELVFAGMHELSHFLDMKKNPEAYIGNFDYVKNKADELAEKYCRKHPDQNFQAIKKNYGSGLHDLYNCLDDIYVNRLVQYKSPKYYNGSGKSDIISLYKKLGFGEADLTSLPQHYQMIYSLLRDNMVGEELGKSIVSEEVENVLNEKYNRKDVRERVSGFRPRWGRDYLVDPQERYEIIKGFIEPQFLGLLEKSLDEESEKQQEQDRNEQENSQNGGQGKQDNQNSKQGEQNSQRKQGGDNQNNGGVNNGEEGEEQNGSSGEQNGDKSNMPGKQKPDLGKIFNQGNEDTICQILDELREDAKVEKMSPEERRKYNKKKAQEKFDKENDISQDIREEFEETKNEIKQARREMQKFWSELVGKSMELEKVILEMQRRGKLDVGSLIKDYPNFVNAEKTGKFGELNIYTRKVNERVLVDKPDTLEISLVVDGSGSMDRERIKIARMTATLLMLSIKDFNEKLIRERRKLRANTEVIMYGSDSEKIKHFENERQGGRKAKDVEIIKSVAKMRANYGGTDDSIPLGDILAETEGEKTQRIKEGRLQKIVFEITDGGTKFEDSSHEQVQTLIRNGVLVFAFQIGNADEWERDKFNYVWNNNEDGKKRGIVLREDEISKLPGQLIEALKDALKGLRV